MFLLRNVSCWDVKASLSDIDKTLKQNALLANRLKAINKELESKKDLQEIYSALKKVKKMLLHLTKHWRNIWNAPGKNSKNKDLLKNVATKSSRKSMNCLKATEV